MTHAPGKVGYLSGGNDVNLWLDLDTHLFDWLAAGTDSPALLPVATEFAQWSGIALLLVALLTLTHEERRLSRAGFYLLSAVLAQTLAHQLAQTWNAPRPFMLGLSPNHLGHGWRGGFPSAHASVMFALAASLWLSGTHWRYWLSAVLLATLTAWARVYTGAHFPLDVLGGALLGLGVAWLCARSHTIVIKPTSRLHQRFG